MGAMTDHGGGDGGGQPDHHDDVARAHRAPERGHGHHVTQGGEDRRRRQLDVLPQVPLLHVEARRHRLSSRAAADTGIPPLGTMTTRFSSHPDARRPTAVRSPFSWVTALSASHTPTIA